MRLALLPAPHMHYKCLHVSAVANKQLNKTTEVVGDNKRHLFISPSLQEDSTFSLFISKS